MDASFLIKRGPAKPNLKDGSIIKRPKSVKYSIMEAARAMPTGLFDQWIKYMLPIIWQIGQNIISIYQKNLNGKGIAKHTFQS